jgi:P27 family predicted phage terminase small subunit
MGLPGRPALPDAIKDAQGTLQKSRVNQQQPRPPAMELGVDPPAWLRGAKRRQAWSELVKLLTDQKVLTVMDPIALGLLVDAFGDYLEAGDVIAGRRCGRCGLALHTKATRACQLPAPGRPYYTTVTPAGSLMIRPHPAVALRDQARRTLMNLLSRFGMDPSSRARIVAAGETEQADPDDAFFEETPD